MSNKCLTFIFTVLLLLGVNLAFAQTDSISAAGDSSSSAAFVEFRNRLAEIERQRLIDSVKKAELEVQLSSLKTTDNLKKEELQRQLQTGLDDFYVSYQINAYIRAANKQEAIYSDLHQHIQDVCNEQGIEIMSLHYRADRDGNMSTIPSDYLPKDYTAPSFKIKTEKDN